MCPTMCPTILLYLSKVGLLEIFSFKPPINYYTEISPIIAALIHEERQTYKY
jgi:hypothetical protein